MNRIAFKMFLKPNCVEEYKERHNKIWPELKSLLAESGVSDYTIFLDEETNVLYGVQKVVGNSNSQDLGSTEIVQKWWLYMSDIMETNPDFSPKSVPLKEVFHMD